MAKNTSIILGPHFDEFVGSQVMDGRYGSTSEVVRAALRLLEEREARLNTLRRALIEGEESGISEQSVDDIWAAAEEEQQPLNG